MNDLLKSYQASYREHKKDTDALSARVDEIIQLFLRYRYKKCLSDPVRWSDKAFAKVFGSSFNPISFNKFVVSGDTLVAGGISRYYMIRFPVSWLDDSDEELIDQFIIMVEQ